MSLIGSCVQKLHRGGEGSGDHQAATENALALTRSEVDTSGLVERDEHWQLNPAVTLRRLSARLEALLRVKSIGVAD